MEKFALRARHERERENETAGQIQVNRKTFHECLGDIGMAEAEKATKQAQITHHPYSTPTCP